jgi:hypothetical protein
MFEGPEPTAPSKGEVAEEGQLGPTKRRALGGMWEKQPPCPASPQAPPSPGPGQFGLCQTHLLQHTARRFILLRQRQTQ